MNFELYEHNAETYSKIIEAWKTNNRVATVQATGTGKTYLILKCLFDNPEMKKAVLAPSNYILEQLERKADYKLPNTELITYSKLSFMSEEEIKELNSSMIIFDEFHRCGAEKWGIGVQMLLNAFPNAKLLGLTATPIRHLDNDRDMSDELFEGNVITNISLPQAIVRGILPMPKYISALYTFDDEILNLKEKIDKSNNNDSEKNELKINLDTLKKKLDRSRGIPVILNKYLSKPGKFIVFCKDKKHLYEMKQTVIDWFKKTRLGNLVETYTIHSGASDNKSELQLFINNNNTDNVRLLFSIDMLNEGLHVDDVNGVILLRPTCSPVIYYQQIGRALQAGNRENLPIVFDLVNNFSSLSGKNFSEELKSVIRKENEKRKSNNTVELKFDNFVIFDEMQEVKDLLFNIEDRLINDWDLMFERYKTKSYYEDDKKMKRWVKYQRLAYRKGWLSQGRIEKLESIKFVWSKIDDLWNKNFDILERFRIKYGHVDVPGKYEVDGIKLGEWVNEQRKKYKKGKLNKERIIRLESMGFSWKVLDDRWVKGFNELRSFKIKNGHVNVPLRYKSNDFKLGEWVASQRKMYKKGKISKLRVNELDMLGFQWKIEDDSWDTFFKELIKFQTNKGHTNVPQKYEIGDMKLGTWASNQRQNYRKGNLSEDRINKLNAIGFQWSIKNNNNKPKEINKHAVAAS